MVSEYVSLNLSGYHKAQLLNHLCVLGWVKMDVINLLSKTDGLPDAPVVDENDPTQLASMHYANGPRVHEYIKEMNQKVLSRKFPSASPTASGTHRMTTDYDAFTVGEAPFSHSADDLAEYVLPQNKELKTIFQFELMDIDASNPLEKLMPKPWKLSDLKNVVEKWQTFKREEGFWNTSVHVSFSYSEKRVTGC
jgi:oligo-1,6-glucosidase